MTDLFLHLFIHCWQFNSIHSILDRVSKNLIYMIQHDKIAEKFQYFYTDARADVFI